MDFSSAYQSAYQSASKCFPGRNPDAFEGAFLSTENRGNQHEEVHNIERGLPRRVEDHHIEWNSATACEER